VDVSRDVAFAGVPGNSVGTGATLGLHAVSTKATINSDKTRFIAKIFPPGSQRDRAEFYHTSGKDAALSLKGMLIACERHPETVESCKRVLWEAGRRGAGRGGLRLRRSACTNPALTI
jgi:hypothetical protein